MTNKINLQITENDYYQAQWIHYKLGPVKFSCVFLASILLGYFFYSNGGVSKPVVVGGVAGWLLWYFGYFLIYLRIRCKKIYQQQKNLSLPAECSWDEKGIYVSNESGSGKMLWYDFVKYRENKDLFLLYQSDVIFNIVPKKAFINEEQLADFKEYAQSINC